jgi:hypothetical protein
MWFEDNINVTRFIPNNEVGQIYAEVEERCRSIDQRYQEEIAMGNIS